MKYLVLKFNWQMFEDTKIIQIWRKLYVVWTRVQVKIKYNSQYIFLRFLKIPHLSTSIKRHKEIIRCSETGLSCSLLESYNSKLIGKHHTTAEGMWLVARALVPGTTDRGATLHWTCSSQPPHHRPLPRPAARVRIACKNASGDAGACSGECPTCSPRTYSLLAVCQRGLVL